MENPNRMALDLVDEAIDFADELNVGVRHLANEAALLDFGIDRRGGLEAGLLLAEVATGGLATVQTRLGTVGGAALVHAELSTDHPAESLLACQSPTWPFDVGGTTARGSGPATLFREEGQGAAHLAERESGFDDADFAVLVVESSRFPDEELAETVASEADVPTSGVFVLVAPPASIAGSVAAAARAAERAVSRYVEIGGDARHVVSVAGTAPVAPIADDEAGDRAGSADALGLGGRVHLIVERDVDGPERLVSREGESAVGLEGVERSGESPGGVNELPAPAQVTVDVVGGPTHVVGGVDEALLRERFEL